MSKRKADNFWLGLAFGIILPLLVLFIFYLSSYAYLTLPEFMRKMVFQSVIFKLMSLCAIINLGSFFLFYQTNNDRAARGVIFATLIFAFIVMFNQIINGAV
tara:strand:- start:260 stop:565 length:306 start_codon:yes stop_codon:yes gene_type:complete